MMSILKNTLVYLRNTLMTIASLILLYLGGGYVLSRITINESHVKTGEIPIYIKTNGVHTDVVLPVRNMVIDWSREIRYGNTVGKDSTLEWIAFGWGDKGFYLQTPEWKDLKFSVAFKAAFGLSSTAIHATFYNKLQESGNCKMIMVDSSTYARLVDYIQSSFYRNVNKQVEFIPTSAIYGKADAFYEAKGRYSLFSTCNSWANGALKAAGLKACLWTAFDKGIFLKYEP